MKPYFCIVALLGLSLSYTFGQTTFPGTRIDGKRVPIRQQWGDIIKDNALKKHAPQVGYIDNAKDFEALWKAWRKDGVPKIDFEKELVYVSTSANPRHFRLVMVLTSDGNLVIISATGNLGFDQQLPPEKSTQGFGYAIAVISRDGIKSIDGKAFPATQEKRPVLKLDESSDSKTVQAVVGQQIEIALKGNITTGFAWGVTKIEGTVLAQQGKVNYTPQKTEEKRVGSGGVYTAVFLAEKEGEGKILLEYKRPWEKTEKPAKTFTVTVKITKPQGNESSVLGLRFFCLEKNKEFTVRVEDIDREAIMDHPSKIRILSPYSKKKTGIQMVRCPVCKKYYVPEPWKDPSMNPETPYKCPYCGTNPEDWYRQKIKDRRTGK